MRIWLITVGEPLPTDGSGERLLRTGILADLLAEKGHQVLWWSSTFDHVRKKQRFDTDTCVDINDRFRIILLHSVPYRKNVSLSRIVNHYGITRKFTMLADLEPRPDIILCSLPTLELSLAATDYGKKRGVPVIVDVRDLWPDIFLELAPVWGRRFARLLLLPMFRAAHAACAGATAITGITPSFVDWGVNYAKRKRTDLDRDFPMGYTETSPGREAVEASEILWERYGINRDSNGFTVCFFGNMGRQFELETIIEAARKLKEKGTLIRFVLCGSGDNLDYYKELSKDCKNVIFPGWVGAADIWTLMRVSSVGLAPYINSRNFTMNLPNKPVEYLSAGLPVVSSLDGVLKELLSSHNCGVTYENGNADDLVSVLTDLYERPELLKEMSENALSLFQEKFVAEKVYSNMINYLALVCANFSKSRGM